MDHTSFKNRSYIMMITIVATLGGLLFGYDTAVISGTVSSLKSFFTAPLLENPELAVRVIAEYRILVTLSFLLVVVLLNWISIRLFGQKKGILYSILIFIVGIVIWYTQFWQSTSAISPEIINSINGFTISSALIGCIIGGSLGGTISQKLGRKGGLILAAVLFIISAIGSAMPDKIGLPGVEIITSFIFYRVIGGIGVGIASMLSPMYIAEIAPAEKRGNLVSWNQFAIIFGMLVVYFVNWGIARSGDDNWLNDIGWRWMFASEIIPATLFFVLLFLVPESPRFMVLQDKADKALSLLSRINGLEKAKSIMSEINESLKEKTAPWLSFGGLLIVIGVLLSVFQQFVGINVVLYYAPEIFKNMGSNTDTSLLQTIIVGVVNLSFTVLAIFTVDRFGRKPLMIIGALIMSASMFAIGFSFYFEKVGLASLIFMLTYVAGFALSWGPVCWVLLSEIFPNSIKGALSIAVAAQWLANLAVSWTFPMMNDNLWLTNIFNHGFSYWIYGIMGIVAAFFIFKLVPETKGKSLEEIEKLWKRN
jgi:MFS transporter, SP family, xylose:H+ symportor